MDREERVALRGGVGGVAGGRDALLREVRCNLPRRRGRFLLVCGVGVCVPNMKGNSVAASSPFSPIFGKA